MQEMIKRTTESLGHGEVIEEAMSTQTQQLAQQNKKDIEGDKHTSSAPSKGLAMSSTPHVDSHVMTHPSLYDQMKQGSTSEPKVKQTEGQQTQSKSVNATMLR